MLGRILSIGIFLCFCCIANAQKDPRLARVVFEPGKISTDEVEYALTFSSSGKELYFSRSPDAWGTRNAKGAIYYAVKKSGTWSSPKLVSFSGTYDDNSPHLTADGQTLYFISQRPSSLDDLSDDIWKVEKKEDGAWGEPVNLGYPINSPETEYSPCTDTQGNLYFASTRPGGLG